ncbi:Cys-Cys-COOH (seleno)protein SaoC [Clostridium sp. Marseille-Q2269]|uniref:Cys-Cys-COOH (seleno)protein SaoC n=1 Tax=Clostridium sp. Marseille-Q2269 TaxID=2942205 RepID=UPI0020736E3A|nr:Cys-Cys-COOH (seleno)protein SaoC [Clostridium sp. Marseille-Q2269]
MRNIKIFFVIVIGFFLSGCFSNVNGYNEKKTIGVKNNNEKLLFFKEKYNKKQVLKCGEKDLNNDNKLDLIVIYKKNSDKNSMVVVLSDKERYKITNEVSAPIENQKIEFKDIDKKAPLEFIISGSKNGNLGYAIYRIEKGKIVDLFGEDMKDCC